MAATTWSRLRPRIRRVVAATFGSASPLVLARLASAALTFGLPLALVRLLDPVAYGAYKQFFLLVSSLLLVGQCGLTQSLYYFLPRGGRARGSYLVQTVLLVWLLSLALGVALWVAAPTVVGWFGASELAPLRTPLALTTALMLAATPLESALTADGRIGGAALAYVLSDGARAGAMVWAAKWGTRWLGPAAIFWAATLVCAVRVLALAGVLGRGLLPTARPSWERLRAQLRYALPYAGATVFFVAQRYCSQYLVSARVDTATFPLFSIGGFHLPLIDIVFTPITEVLMVTLGRTLLESPGASRDAFADATNKLAAVLFPATAGAWLLGSTVLPLLFTARYRAAVPLFQLATLEIPFCILPGDALLRAAGDTRYLFWFNAVRVVVTVALVLLGIHLAALPGAMLGAVIAESWARVAMICRGRRHLGGSSLTSLFDWPFLGRTAVASALACLPTIAVDLFLPSSASRVLLAMAVYGASYLVMRELLRRGPSDASLTPAPIG